MLLIIVIAIICCNCDDNNGIETRPLRPAPVAVSLKYVYDNLTKDTFEVIECRNNPSGINYHSHKNTIQQNTTTDSYKTIEFYIESAGAMPPRTSIGNLFFNIHIDKINNDTTLKAKIVIDNVMETNEDINEPKDLEKIGIFENDLKITFKEL